MTAAADFLQWLRPGGPWTITAIIPDGMAVTRTETSAAGVAGFVRKYDGERNIYYAVNPLKRAMAKKAKKMDVLAGEFVHADLDPREDETPEAAKARYMAALKAYPLKASAVVDSGNGIQALWRLDKACLDFAAVESVSEVVTLALGGGKNGKAQTHNIDRVLRPPGTINLPTKKKLSEGRVVCQSSLVSANDTTHRMDDFPKARPKPESQARPEPQSTDGAAPRLRRVVSRRIARLIKKGSEPNDRYGGDRSRAVYAVCCVLVRSGWSNDEIETTILDPANGISAHVLTQANPAAYARKQVADACEDVGDEPPWRDLNFDGSPKTTMHNARLAITALGIECSYDTFHSRMLFGYHGGDRQHELQSFLGEVSDDGIISLRRVVSDTFAFDPRDEATRDGVKSLALEHSFDPVCDMLKEAEGHWDGVERLDRMAHDHLNCDDVPLHRAMVRKWMIAAVRRARRPGCKFDNILVLESDEGWNKSSALQVLAGEGNFSDESILGRGGREVQEHLAVCWIHESADLHGMRRADVEHIKAFASRQVDRARPAYGRYLKEQPRHSVEGGTTNDDVYLQSQTGNRRFWPMTVRRMIDLDRLTAERLQLWGEAAAYETAGESVVLDKSLWPDAGEVQEERRIKDPWEDILADIPSSLSIYDQSGRDTPITIVHRRGGIELVATASLLEHVLRIPRAQQDRAHTMRLAAVMKLLGWRRGERGNKLTVNGKQVRGYFRGEDLVAAMAPIGEAAD